MILNGTDSNIGLSCPKGAFLKAPGNCTFGTTMSWMFENLHRLWTRLVATVLPILLKLTLSFNKTTLRFAFWNPLTFILNFQLKGGGSNHDVFAKLLSSHYNWLYVCNLNVVDDRKLPLSHVVC